MTTTTEHLLSVRGLRVSFPGPAAGPGADVPAVRDVDFTLRRGETVALVGESGSGKSTTALALNRMLPGAGRIAGGSVRLDGAELTAAEGEELRGVRGARIGMIFQDPMTSLNPVLSVGAHLDEVLRAHGSVRGRGRGARAERRARAVELLELVGIPEAGRRVDDHPHQFSGGQRQRVLIAMALANEPDLLIADEPTTALDATVQEQILDLLTDLNRRTGTALLLITHNMGVVARSCARMMVMYAGEIVEDGPTERVLTRPRHPYTRGLLSAVPRLSAPSGTRLAGIPGSPPDLSALPPGCAFAARCPSADDHCGEEAPPLVAEGAGRAACWHPVGEGELLGASYEGAAYEGAAYGERAYGVGPGGDSVARPVAPAPLIEVEDLRKEFPRRGSAGRRGRDRITAVDGVSLRLAPGETLGIVGESGSGKSTLARILAHAHPADGGAYRLRGEDVLRPSRGALRGLRREVQMVFQDPYASLNPRMTVGESVAEPLRAHGLHGTRRGREQRVAELLTLVGLDPSAAARRPRAFSGGQRQRIGIARALAPEPSVLLCDEPVSALDVSVQAQIVNLLAELQRELGLAMLFIAHDLAVVRQVSHRIAVMREGCIVETGPADELCTDPQHPYTRTLLAAAPEPEPRAATAPAEGVPA
ncbi:ABC transporter ATP-binding protein [Streptomyces sp. ODS28]|uniref:ABC transporter ATP-binding protein n=1 Tax=Streptomyces sp. ODS28 TaxID=3136688 RepID=UPI0031EEB551